MPKMHFLPPELHHEILRYLSRPDVASCRLVCQKLANTGAHHLFERLHVHTSLESLQRLARISKLPYGAHVKHLLWNTTGSEHAAEPFFEGLRMRELKYILSDKSSSTTTVTEQKTTAPQSPTPNIGVFVLQAIFSGFPGLHSLYILTSGTPPAASPDSWKARPTDPSLAAWPEPWKSQLPCPKCPGLCSPRASNARYEMAAALAAAANLHRPLRSLRVDNLSLYDMSMNSCNSNSFLDPALNFGLGNLTSLSLTLLLPPTATPHLSTLLASTPSLRSLTLFLHASSFWPAYDHGYSPLLFHSLFPTPCALPHLHTLELHQLDVSPTFFTSFLRAHTHSLRVLKLHRLRLDPPMASAGGRAGAGWKQLFVALEGALELDDCWLDGYFDDRVSGEVGVDFNGKDGFMWERKVLGTW